MDLRAYFLRGEKLVVVHRSVPATPRVAAAAMRQLLAGPSLAERKAGLVTTIPIGTRLLGVAITSGTATVDLSHTYESGGGSLSMSARLAQVTFTLTQFPTVRRVTFEIAGTPVTVFGGEGIILDHPVTRASYEHFSPAILVETPGWGATVHSPLAVRGTANVFEAQFTLELRDAKGKLIARREVHASSGTGTRGIFSLTLRFTPRPGAATLVVYDRSAKDGTPLHVVRVPLHLIAS